MKKVTALQKPVLVPFNPSHPHKFYQKVLVTVRSGESVDEKPWFVSCPKSGLTPDLLSAFLISHIGVHEDLDTVDGENDGVSWEGVDYWRNDRETCARGIIVDGNEIYSAKDEQLLNYRRYCPENFAYSLDAVYARKEKDAELPHKTNVAVYEEVECINLISKIYWYMPSKPTKRSKYFCLASGRYALQWV